MAVDTAGPVPTPPLLEPESLQPKQKQHKPVQGHSKKASKGHENGAQKCTAPKKGLKGPKGPKGTKPKAQTHQFYFQQLASDMADRMMKGNQYAAAPKILSDKSPSTPGHSRRTTTTTTTITQREIITTIITELPDSTRSSSSSEHQVPPAPSFPPLHSSTPSPIDKQCRIFTLDDLEALGALEALMERYGSVSHGGIFDKSYSFFVSRNRDAALSFKVKDKVAVIGGDPLCDPSLFRAVLGEFKEYRKQHGLGVALFGGSDTLLRYAKEDKWCTMRFGTERVLNPMDNPVLQEKVQKQVIRQNKQLLDPLKGGITIDVYSPSVCRDPALQQQLVGVYEAWRTQRNESGVPQAYTTVYDPFALPNLMVYIYTRDRDGNPNGFAALRKMGAKNGYYIDPCVAAPGAPRRITDLLYFAAMALLNTIGISYLSIGMEPSPNLEINGFPGPLAKLARRIHGRIFRGLKLAGKKEYHDKFRPDETRESGLHLMFPSGMPGPRHLVAVMHAANISVRKLLSTKLDYKGAGAKDKHANTAAPTPASEES